MGKEATTITREISKAERVKSSVISVNSVKPKSEKPILQTQEKTKIKSLSINKNSKNIQQYLQKINNINIARKSAIKKTGKGQRWEVKNVIHKTKNLKVKSKIIHKAIHANSLSTKNAIIIELAHIVHNVNNYNKLSQNIKKDVMQNFIAVLHSSNLNPQQKIKFSRILIPKLPLNAINSMQRYIDNNFSKNASILQGELSNAKLSNTEIQRLSNLQQYNPNIMTQMPLSNNLYSYNLELQDFTRQYNKNNLPEMKFNDENNDGIIDIKDIKYTIEKELHNLYPNEYPNPQTKDFTSNIDEEVYSVDSEGRHNIEDYIFIIHNDIQKIKEDSDINLAIDSALNLNVPKTSNDSYTQEIKSDDGVEEHSFVKKLEKQRSTTVKQQNFEVSI